MANSQASISTWSRVVEQIGDGSASAAEELYKTLHTIFFFFRRHMGPDRAVDACRNVVTSLASEMGSGALRKDGCLPTYHSPAFTVRKEHSQTLGSGPQTANALRTTGPAFDSSENPEQAAHRSERHAIAEMVLSSLPPQERETLVRFYLDGESEENIIAAMGLTAGQFRGIKLQARMKYAALVAQCISPAHNRIVREN